MTSQISDLTQLPANMPVLCIPRVHRNIDETQIRKIFNDLNMGMLDRIDIVIKRNDNKRNDNKRNDNKRNDNKDNNFNRVFVHFREWNDSENAKRARERLLEGKEIKIIYDEPWFWKVSAYKEGELRPNKRTQTK